jgi:hypothetical protein
LEKRSKSCPFQRSCRGRGGHANSCAKIKIGNLNNKCPGSGEKTHNSKRKKGKQQKNTTNLPKTAKTSRLLVSLPLSCV